MDQLRIPDDWPKVALELYVYLTGLFDVFKTRVVPLLPRFAHLFEPLVWRLMGWVKRDCKSILDKPLRSMCEQLDDAVVLNEDETFNPQHDGWLARTLIVCVLATIALVFMLPARRWVGVASGAVFAAFSWAAHGLILTWAVCATRRDVDVFLKAKQVRDMADSCHCIVFGLTLLAKAVAVGWAYLALPDKLKEKVLQAVQTNPVMEHLKQKVAIAEQAISQLQEQQSVAEQVISQLQEQHSLLLLAQQKKGQRKGQQQVLL